MISYRMSLIALCAGVLFFSCKEEQPPAVPAEPAKVPVPTKYGVTLPGLKVVEATVEPGSSLGRILASRGLRAPQIHQAAQASVGIWDHKKLRDGDSVAFFLDSASGGLRHLVVRPDPFHWIRFDIDSVPKVLDIRRPIDTVRREVRGTIESSLWNVMAAKGMSASLIGRVSDILAWQVDFFALQVGDEICLVYDELRVDGRVAGEGDIHAVSFRQGDSVSRDFLFRRGEIDGYYDEWGRPNRRAFLKAPLQYSRISSRFTGSRMHPVLRIVRPHFGVDYAAPSGTPVVALGDGTVILKGWLGGGGNSLKIRHGNGYITGYMHLKAFASGLRQGSRVRQGDLIGYVGSTGLSTGPHLDFRVWDGIRPIDPLRISSPPSPPLPDSLKVVFQAAITPLVAILDGRDSVAAGKKVAQAP
ncbi:MAG: peptidoglycan DD-metalloendopeptidase family protein [Fibrobacterota bacterium]|nr:MAG: peptidoglycan DD-metalloendopeptidase family protein [Fibrobacterota bacterium]